MQRLGIRSLQTSTSSALTGCCYTGGNKGSVRYTQDLTSPLSHVDPEIFNLTQQEKQRQVSGIELIASENFTSQAVMEVCKIFMNLLCSL